MWRRTSTNLFQTLKDSGWGSGGRRSRLSRTHRPDHVAWFVRIEQCPREGGQSDVGAAEKVAVVQLQHGEVRGRRRASITALPTSYGAHTPTTALVCVLGRQGERRRWGLCSLCVVTNIHRRNRQFCKYQVYGGFLVLAHRAITSHLSPRVSRGNE